MSNQLDIAALRAGCDECEQAQRGGIVVIPRDMRALLDAYDERDRLRAEVDSLKCRAEAAEDAVASWVSSERDEFRAEVERLRADVTSVCDAWVHGDGPRTTDWLVSHLMPIAQRGAALTPPSKPEPIDPNRCEVCGWTLAESRDKGCVAGDCSYRPEQGSDEWYRIKARREALTPPSGGEAQRG